MPSGPGGVPAAPNRSEITAVVVQLEQSPAFADKWLLQLEIRSSRSLEGPNFARVGAVADAFTVEPVAGLIPGTQLKAQAEYLGDARGGTFQLRNIEVLDAESP
jgi:hypothetical protein